MDILYREVVFVLLVDCYIFERAEREFVSHIVIMDAAVCQICISLRHLQLYKVFYGLVDQ